MKSTPSNLEAEEWRKRHLRRRWQLVISVYGLSLLFMNLGSGRVLTRHEVFTAQPAREMLHGGNLIVPSFLGKPRTKKPPTMSWLIAASMALFRSQAEWVARLPSVLAAILTALLIGSLAAQWFDELTGLLAGLMQCAVVYVFMQARLAEADIESHRFTVALEIRSLWQQARETFVMLSEEHQGSANQQTENKNARRIIMYIQRCRG